MAARSPDQEAHQDADQDADGKAHGKAHGQPHGQSHERPDAARLRGSELAKDTKLVHVCWPIALGHKCENLQHLGFWSRLQLLGELAQFCQSRK